MREEERGDESVKHVENLYRVPRVAFQLARLSVCITRADRVRLGQGNAEREDFLDNVGTCGAS
ncbi:hypothetical protein MTR_4g049350 [Medicago truncatula]|uniref:Uncharacterized protein n=1 Tax=Medicago truncatula TaxID=3880 RepID=G7JDK8_MEDTR|nr:hypothetical protein MTR_4g049350 [Medicago truncatula]